MIVFSEIKRCQHPHFTQIFQKAKKTDDAGADGVTPLLSALQLGADPAVVSLLLSGRADPDASSPWLFRKI